MYRVVATITVDHPEKRDGTFRPVPPGTKLPWELAFATQGAAVAEWRAILRGDWDFASEFISRVAVYADRSRASARIVRREVMRERPLVVRVYEGPGAWSCLRKIAPSAVHRPPYRAVQPRPDLPRGA